MEMYVVDIATLQRYADLGLRIHPLKVKGKTPAIKGWADDATTDAAKIQEWLEKFPAANWGFVAGNGSNVTVVDVDPRNGGGATWGSLIAKNGEPAAPMVRTARGGMHYYFKYFHGRHKLGDGVDVLSNRNNVVLPPSQTEDGTYEWVNGFPKSLPLAPPWLRKLAKVEAGSRNEDAYRAACNMFRTGATVDVVLDEMLAEFGDETDPEHNEGIRKTVHSAYDRVRAPRNAFVNYNGANAEDFDSYIASDYGNAQLLTKYVGSDVLFIKDVGWVVYREGRWQFDDSLVYNRLTQIMNEQRVHYAEAAGRTSDKAVEKELRSREAHFTISTNNRTVKNSIEMAQSIEKFASNLGEFDNGHTSHLLNFTNGTVDLRTGVLHPHNRNDFITKMCPSPYVPDTDAPFWKETLRKIFSEDDEMVQYVQTMLGASMLGSQDIRMLFIAYGRLGKNGKSTLFETLAEVLGDYADHAELKMLASTDTGNLTELTTRMRIRGARLVFSSEMTSSDQVDANMIKRLTGGDTISARSMFKATVTFRPICSIWLRTNALPLVKGADKAFWDRICVIPFDHQFLGDEQLDMGVVMERLKAEAVGILSWLVQGAVIWNNRNGGFAIPRRVQELRETYMTDTDMLGDFFSEALRMTPGAEAKIASLHRAYSDFCKRRGLPAPAIISFKQELRGAGLLSSDGKVVRGYTLDSDFGLGDL